MYPTLYSTSDQWYGYAASIYHKTCIVGSSNKGAYIYALQDGTWQNIGSFDYASYGVSIFKDLVIIGSPGLDVYIFGGIEPSFAPTLAPTTAPSTAPTNEVCDATIQTYNTFLVCSFLQTLETLPNDLTNDQLHTLNYCNSNESNITSKYFKCSSSDESNEITHIYLNDSGIGGPLNDSALEWLFKLTQLTTTNLANQPCFDAMCVLVCVCVKIVELFSLLLDC